MTLGTNLIKTLVAVIVFMLSNYSLLSAASFDNVLKAIFYSQNDSSYLILHESLYHPTSATYEKGNMRSQGYTTSRISVYAIKSGRLVSQKNMGIMDNSEACYILGCSPNNLWIYSKKFNSGLQSIHPLTLEKSISQATIYKNINISMGRFHEPEWQNIKKYYGYDIIQEKLIVSNSGLQMFYIDTRTFATQPIFDKINLPNQLNKYTDESVIFKDSLWVLKGYDAMRFSCGTYSSETPNYLYGKFILDLNFKRLFHHFNAECERLANIKEQSGSLNPIYDSGMIEVLIRNSKDNLESLINGNKPNDVLLQPDPNSFFVISKSKDEPDAFIKISKVKSEQFGLFSETWSVSPTGMFYNVAQARNTKLFKQYFGDISPEFDYQFLQVHNNKLIVIYLLQMCCIDIDSGKILWQIRLN